MPGREADEEETDEDGGESQDDGGDDGEGASKRKPKSKKPKTLKHAAETLGVSIEDLYLLEIPSARQGEKPYTLGALKDLAAKQDDFSERDLTLNADRRAFERERVTAEVELRETMAAIPEDALKPEALKKLRAGIQKKHAREAEAAVRVIPEWADDARRTQDLRGMVDFLKGYGLPETTLMEHFDHRIMRVVRDAWLTVTAVEKALAKVKERRGSSHARSNANGGQQQKRGEKPTGGDVRSNRQVRGFMDTIAAAAAHNRT